MMNRKCKIKFIYAVLMGIIFVGQVVSMAPLKASAASANFYLSPSSGSVNLGDTISASVMISTDTAINAGEATVTFSSNILEYQSVSTGGSIFSFWTSGPSGGSTSVSFGGGLSNPGYSGGSGKVLTITWKAINTGTATVSINGTKILANDGIGTNILSGSGGGSFGVVASGAPAGSATTGTTGSTGTSTASLTMNISSSSHSDQNKWYTGKDVNLNWSARGATGYLVAFNQSAGTVPTGSGIAATSKSYPNNVDGVWYFHARAQGNGTTGPVAHFKIQIDTSPPADFTITINQEGGATNATPKVTFEAKDATSGIDRYEAKIDNGDSFVIASGDKLPKQHPGNHTITIKAFDKAGNATESKASYKIEGISAPNASICSKVVGLLQPVYIEGTADKGDTVVIFLNGKEVDRFLAEDKKIDPKQAKCLDNAVYASDNNQITWRYTYQQPLYPGEYPFQLMRINKDGAESELTQALKVSVVSSTITAFGRTVPTNYVIWLLLAVIFILSSAIVYILYRMRHLAKRGGAAAGLVFSKIKNIFIKSEKDIDKEVDEAITDSGVSRSGAEITREDLKKKVHEIIAEEESGINKKQ